MRALVMLALVGGCGPTTVRVSLTLAAGTPSQSEARLSVYDRSGPVLLDRRLAPLELTQAPTKQSSLLVVLPDADGELRVVAVGEPGVEGGRLALPRAHEDVAVTLELAANAADADGDGVPDPFDNCPEVANHDQKSSDGLRGDACGASVDLATPNDDGGAPADGGEAVDFQVMVPAHRSLHYGSHDLPARTVTFTHRGDSAECSHDGGNSWGACDSAGSLVWTIADYTGHATVAVRVKKAGQPDFVWSYTPSTEQPGLNFYPCDDVVSAAEDAATFNARLTAGRNVCLGGGVTLSGAIVLDTSARILGLESDRALFTSAAMATLGLGTGTGRPVGAVVANLRVHNTGTGNAVEVESGGDCAFSDVEITATSDIALNLNYTDSPAYVFYECDISSQGLGMAIGNQSLVNVFHSRINSGANNAITSWDASTCVASFQDCDIRSGDTQDSAINKGGSGSFAFTRTLLSGPITVLAVAGGSVTLTDSHLVSSTLDLSLAAGTQVTLTRTVLDTKDGAVRCANGTLQLDGSTFRRVNQIGGSSAAIDAVGGCTLNTTVDGNHFCDESLAQGNGFSQPVSGAFSGSLMLANQVNGGVIDSCP